jgi:hypothetical protein
VHISENYLITSVPPSTHPHAQKKNDLERKTRMTKAFSSGYIPERRRMKLNESFIDEAMVVCASCLISSRPSGRSQFAVGVYIPKERGDAEKPPLSFSRELWSL